MPRIGEPDRNDPRAANVWNGDAWVPARQILGGSHWVWDQKASGTCLACDEAAELGESVYRMPRRPWRRRNDPIVHVRCWNEFYGGVAL